MRQLGAGISAGIHFGPHLGHDAKSLMPDEQAAGDGRGKDEADCCQRTDLASDDDETGDFGERKRKYEQGKERNSQIKAVRPLF